MRIYVSACLHTHEVQLKSLRRTHNLNLYILIRYISYIALYHISVKYKF